MTMPGTIQVVGLSHHTAPVDAKAVYTAAFRAVLTEFHGLSEGSADMSSALEPWLRRIHEESP